MIAGACIEDIGAAHRIARRTVTADDGVVTTATADQCGRTAARLQKLPVTTASNEFVGAFATVDAVRAYGRPTQFDCPSRRMTTSSPDEAVIFTTSGPLPVATSTSLLPVTVR